MKKKIVRWILPVCMMLLLAGCGKSSNTVVTGTYYNPSKDAENTAQTVGTEADANDVLDAMKNILNHMYCVANSCVCFH